MDSFTKGGASGPDARITARISIAAAAQIAGAKTDTATPGDKSAKTAGASPTTLYLLTENVDKVVATAMKLGATPQMPVADMF